MATAVWAISVARNVVRLGLGIGLVLVLGACSFSINSGTVGERVASELEEGGPGVMGDEDIELDATCDEPDDEVEGATFECRSTGGPGEVRWQIVLDGDEGFDAATINLVTAAGLDELLTLVAAEATRVSGVEVGPGDVDCGSAPVVAGLDLALTCAVTVPGAAEPVEADVTLTDITETGDGRTDIASITFDDLEPSGTESAASTAASVIETEAAALGLGQVTVTCDEPADEEIGTSFGCASASALGVVGWLVTITDVGRISANTTNLIRADLADRIEQVAVESLEAQTGATLGVENFECGDGPFVLDANLAMICGLTQPSTGNVYDATLTFTDLDTGAFQVNVSSEPRP